jgi:hypothetical protein
MTTVNLSPVLNGVSILGATGLPLSGGLVYTYQAGSSAALATYTSSGGTIPNSNPIVLNSDGRAPSEIWLEQGYSYKFQIKTALGAVIQTLDNIYGVPQSAGGGGGTTVPSGCIIIWSGAIGSVPTGYVLCDGTNSTPDLRNSFVIGAGNTYSVGQTGGSKDAIVVTHTHTATSVVTDPGHLHTTANGGFLTPSGGTGSFGGGGAGSSLTNTNSASTGITVATTNASAGVSGTNANLPPYYALAFIMKT